MAKWSDLCLDVLVSIAKLMVLVEDFLAFGLVCKAWRLAAAKENFIGGLTHQVPLLLSYPKGYYTDTLTSDVGEFYNLRKGKAHRKHSLVEAKSYDVNSSSLGWLITVTKGFEASLLHPLNHHPMVKLPNCKIDPRYRDDWCDFRRAITLNKFALSSSPSSTSDYVVIAIHDFSRRLAFCRPGDNGWTMIKDPPNDTVGMCCDVIYYKGKFHIVDIRGRIWVCDIEDSGEARARLIIDQGLQGSLFHLVESRGVLLAVTKATRKVKQTRLEEFRVFEVPFSTRNWADSELTDLGSRILFLSERCSLCIEASTYSGCEKNCIYDITSKHRLRIFSMADYIMRPYTGEYSDSYIPDLWIQPSL